MGLTIAADIGGTFTDLLGYDPVARRQFSAKSPTTPGDFALAIQHCLEKAGVPASEIETFVHGSTVAINTVIERKGARTALIVTQGTRDVYTIGRGNRPDAYDIWFERPRPLVPRSLTFEVEERLGPAGEVRTPFNTAQGRAVAAKVALSGAEAVAVGFLHSWSNPSHEQIMGEIIERALPDVYVTLSHEILREYGEYERFSTAVLNAYIGPKVRGYLEELERRLQGGGFRGNLLIMQSNGGVMSPSTAKRRPVAMLESGPVGGFIAAARVGCRLGYQNVIAFDMGGTTAKTNLTKEGEPQMAHGYHIGGYATGQPMMLPVVDTVEIGSGGGSVAWVDKTGALHVGPHSAGAEPGPACYGKGGEEPTITDANLVLGRLAPLAFLGGEMPLDAAAARAAVRSRIAQPLGLSETGAALAIVEIAVMKMALAVRQVSVERGYDPRDFAMVAFGGAGPLHAVEVARALHIPVVIVPNFPGQFSAAGMLIADLRHDFVRTYYKGLDGADFQQLRAIMGEMETLGRERLAGEHASEAEIVLQHFFDIRYAGQDFSIPVPVQPDLFGAGGAQVVGAAFNKIHHRRFGYNDPDQALEIVNVRITAAAKRPYQELPSPLFAGGSNVRRRRDVVLAATSTPVAFDVFERGTLGPGDRIVGPAIIQEYASTTLLFPGDAAEVAPTGEIIIQLGKTR